MAENKSSHVLNTSANLLGLCFVVLASIKAMKVGGQTVIDDFTTVALFLFMSSCLLSFLSIRSEDAARSRWYENVASYIFLAGLLSMFVITVMLVMDVIN